MDAAEALAEAYRLGLRVARGEDRRKLLEDIDRARALLEGVKVEALEEDAAQEGGLRA